MRNIDELYIELFQNPFIIKSYRDLYQYYKVTGHVKESLAFLNLIENRFNGKISSSDNYEKQSESN
jgi:hypothetical protein